MDTVALQCIQLHSASTLLRVSRGRMSLVVPIAYTPLLHSFSRWGSMPDRPCPRWPRRTTGRFWGSKQRVPRAGCAECRPASRVRSPFRTGAIVRRACCRRGWSGVRHLRVGRREGVCGVRFQAASRQGWLRLCEGSRPSGIRRDLAHPTRGLSDRFGHRRTHAYDKSARSGPVRGHY